MSTSHEIHQSCSYCKRWAVQTIHKEIPYKQIRMTYHLCNEHILLWLRDFESEHHLPPSSAMVAVAAAAEQNNNRGS